MKNYCFLLFFFLVSASLFAVTDDPFAALDPKAYPRNGVLYARSHGQVTDETEKKIIQLENELKADPANGDKWYQLALLYNQQTEDTTRGLSSNFKSQRFPEAELAFKKTIELDPKNVDALLKLSCLYLWERKFSEARPLLEKVIKIQPENGDAWALVGELYENGGAYDIKSYDEAYEKALRLDPKMERSFSALTNYLLEKGRFRDSFLEAKKYFLLHPNSNAGLIITLPALFPNPADREWALDETEKTLPDSLSLWKEFQQFCVRLGESDRASRAGARAAKAKLP